MKNTITTCILMFLFCFFCPVHAALEAFSFRYNIVDVTQLQTPISSDTFYFDRFGFSIFDSSDNLQSVSYILNTNPDLLENKKKYSFISRSFYCYPNPFSRKTGTTLGYFIPSDADIVLKIYTMFGALIYEHTFLSGDEGGKGLPHYNRVMFTQNMIGSNNLSAGTYFAFLLLNGRVIGKTKLAVLP